MRPIRRWCSKFGTAFALRLRRRRAQKFFGVPNVSNPGSTRCDVAHLSQRFLSDPRAVYDPVGQRFWAAMLQVENAFGIAPDCSFKSVYYIVVSQTSDPRGAWNVYEFNMSLDAQFAADFTQIGVNAAAVFFSGNMGGPSTGLNGGFYAEVFEANKANMELGQGGFTAEGFFNLQAQGPELPPRLGRLSPTPFSRLSTWAAANRARPSPTRSTAPTRSPATSAAFSGAAQPTPVQVSSFGE